MKNCDTHVGRDLFVKKDGGKVKVEHCFDFTDELPSVRRCSDSFFIGLARYEPGDFAVQIIFSRFSAGVSRDLSELRTGQTNSSWGTPVWSERFLRQLDSYGLDQKIYLEMVERAVAHVTDLTSRKRLPTRIAVQPCHFSLASTSVSAQDLQRSYPLLANAAILGSLMGKPVQSGEDQARNVTLVLGEPMDTLHLADIEANLIGTSYRLPTREACARFAAQYPSYLKQDRGAIGTRPIICFGFTVPYLSREGVMEIRSDETDENDPCLHVTDRGHVFIANDRILLEYNEQD